MVYCKDDDVRDALRKEMHTRDVNQAELSDLAGLSHQKVSRMLNKENLRFSEINALCDALNCDLCISIRPRDRMPEADKATDILRRAINIIDGLERRGIGKIK